MEELEQKLKGIKKDYLFLQENLSNEQEMRLKLDEVLEEKSSQLKTYG